MYILPFLDTAKLILASLDPELLASTHAGGVSTLVRIEGLGADYNRLSSLHSCLIGSCLMDSCLTNMCGLILILHLRGTPEARRELLLLDRYHRYWR